MSSPWHEIRDHLMQSSRTLCFQRSFGAMRRTSDALARFRDPAAVLDALQRHGAPDAKNRVLVALVQAAQSRTGPAADCALTVTLLALWPGLDAVRRRLIWRRIGPADEVGSEVLARAIAAIRCLDLRRVNRVAATLLCNVERDLVRGRQRDDRHHRNRSAIDPDDIATGNSTHLALLRRDVTRLVGADAPLVMRVAVDGFSQSEVARELGLSEAATRKRYQRANRRLRHARPEFS